MIGSVVTFLSPENWAADLGVATSFFASSPLQPCRPRLQLHPTPAPALAPAPPDSEVKDLHCEKKTSEPASLNYFRRHQVVVCFSLTRLKEKDVFFQNLIRPSLAIKKGGKYHVCFNLSYYIAEKKSAVFLT